MDTSQGRRDPQIECGCMIGGNYMACREGVAERSAYDSGEVDGRCEEDRQSKANANVGCAAVDKSGSSAGKGDNASMGE